VLPYKVKYNLLNNDLDINMNKNSRVGRKPMGNRAMTPVEKNRRMLVRRRLLHNEAKLRGYSPKTVLLSDTQLEALKEYEESWGGTLTPDKLNTQIFAAIKHYLNAGACDSLKTINQEDLPQYCESEQIYIRAGVRFNQWENQQ